MNPPNNKDRSQIDLRSNLTSCDNSDSESEIRLQTLSGPYSTLSNMGYFTSISSASSFGSGLSDATSSTHEPTAAAGFLSSRFCTTESFDNQEFTTHPIQPRNTDVDFFMDSSDDTLTSMHSGYRNRFNNCGLSCTRESSNSSQSSTRSRSTLGMNTGSPMSAMDLCHVGGSQSEDESPVFHSITRINGSETSNLCSECRYSHVGLSMRTCSCSCHACDSEYRTTTTCSMNGFTENLMKSNKYESPVKKSWITNTTATPTHPSFPSLTTAPESRWMACNNSSMNYFSLSNYDPPIETSSTNPLARHSLRNSELPSSPSSTTTLELTGDVRTIDFNSYDQSPLRI